MPDETPNTPATPAAAPAAVIPPGSSPTPAPAPATGTTQVPGTSTTFNVNLPAGTPTPATTPPPTPATPAGPVTVTLPWDQIQALQAAQTRLATLEAEQRQRDHDVQQREAQLLAETGKVKEALEMLRKQSDDQVNAERVAKAKVEERTQRYALDGELARTLASQPLVPGGAEQLTQLWRHQFQVEAQGDTYAVRTPTFETVQAFVARNLAMPEYAHFVRAQNPGGGTGGGNLGSQTIPTPTTTAAPQAPVINNLGDALLENLKAAGVGQYGNPGVKSQGFGLKRVS